MFFGFILLVIGIVLILKAFGIVTMVSWTLFLGVLLLVLGLKMIVRKKNCMHCDWFGHKDHNKDNGN